MKNIGLITSLAFSIYILTNLVNWKAPGFFDYSIIIIYSVCLILVGINITLNIKRSRLLNEREKNN